MDDLLAERHERGAGQLEARNSERDPDQRDAEEDSGDQVTQRQPPAGEDEPENVPDHRQCLVASRGDQSAPERPEGEAGQLERLHPERYADDRDAHDEAGDDVGDRHPDAREDQPDDVEKKPHVSTLTTKSALRQSPGSRRGPRRRRRETATLTSRASTAHRAPRAGTARSGARLVRRGGQPRPLPARRNRSRSARVADRGSNRAGGALHRTRYRGLPQRELR